MRGSVRSLFGVAALGVAAFSHTSPASAIPLYTGQIPCLNAVLNSPDPVALSVGALPVLCPNPGNPLTEIFANATASPGHVGVGLKDTDSGFTGSWDAFARFSDQVTFSAKPGQQVPANNLLPESLNLDIAGLIMGAGSFGAGLRALGSAPGNSFDFILRVSPTDCQFSAVGVVYHIAPGFIAKCSEGTGGLGGTLVTDAAFVPLNQALNFDFGLDVFGFANPGNWSGDFQHSLDLPIGSDVFTLPDGFTANDEGGFIVNNRFVGGPAAAVPEPASAALLIAGFAGLFGFRRRLGLART